MKKKLWSEEEKQFAKDLLEIHGRDFVAIAAGLNGKFGQDRTPTAVRKQLFWMSTIAKGEAEKIEYDDFMAGTMKEMEKRASVIKAPRREEVFTGQIEEDAILLLSDMHIGKVNYFVDLGTDEPYMTYNEEIMYQQINTLLEGIGRINALLSSGYKIRKLYIFGLGDLLDNDMITRGHKFFIDKGVGDQLMLAVEIFKQLIMEFLKTFEQVEFIIVPGNHGRMTEKPSRSPTSNNFDWILGSFLEKLFAEEPRVEVHPANSWFHLKDIHGWKYLLHHGNTVYSWMSLPYFGITRRGKERRTEIPIDFECLGHFHTQMKVKINSYSQTLLNGCWIDKDDFSWQKYATLSHPQQTYFGVSKKRPMTWCFDIDLNDGETGGRWRQWASWARLREQFPEGIDTRHGLQPDGGEEGF